MNTENELLTISRAIEKLYLYTLETLQQDPTPAQSSPPSNMSNAIPHVPEVFLTLDINSGYWNPESNQMQVHPSWNSLGYVLLKLKECYIKYMNKIPLNTIIMPNSPSSNIPLYDTQQVTSTKMIYYSILQYNILCRVQRCLELLHNNEFVVP